MLNLNFTNRKSNTKLTSARSHVYRKEENRNESTPEWVVHPGLGSARPPIEKTHQSKIYKLIHHHAQPQFYQ